MGIVKELTVKGAYIGLFSCSKHDADMTLPIFSLLILLSFGLNHLKIQFYDLQCPLEVLFPFHLLFGVSSQTEHSSVLYASLT